MQKFTKFMMWGNERFSSISRAACILLVLMLLVSTAAATNQVVFDVVSLGTNTPVDTLYAGDEYELRIHIENDEPIMAMQLPLRLFWKTRG